MFGYLCTGVGGLVSLIFLAGAAFSYRKFRKLERSPTLLIGGVTQGRQGRGEVEVSGTVTDRGVFQSPVQCVPAVYCQVEIDVLSENRRKQEVVDEKIGEEVWIRDSSGLACLPINFYADKDLVHRKEGTMRPEEAAALDILRGLDVDWDQTVEVRWEEEWIAPGDTLTAVGYAKRNRGEADAYRGDTSTVHFLCDEDHSLTIAKHDPETAERVALSNSKGAFIGFAVCAVSTFLLWLKFF